MKRILFVFLLILAFSIKLFSYDLNGIYNTIDPSIQIELNNNGYGKQIEYGGKILQEFTYKHKTIKHLEYISDITKPILKNPFLKIDNNNEIFEFLILPAKIKYKGKIQDFIFGYVTKGINSWLKYGAGDQPESLTSTITFKLSYKTGTKEVVTSGEGQNTTLTVKWADATQTFLETAVTNGYITAVPALTPSLSGDTYSVTVTFQWGELFNSENPFKWYNDHKVSDEYTWKTATGLPGTKGDEGTTTGTYGDHAAEFLNDMYIYFSNGTQAYTILVDAQPKE